MPTRTRHACRNQSVPLPEGQLRRAAPRSGERRDRRDRRAGGGADRGRAQGHRLDADRHPGDAPSRRPHRRHRRTEERHTAAAWWRRRRRPPRFRWWTRPCARATRSSVGTLSANVIETPGHTAGHITYWFHADKLAFAGDTLFSIGCGRVIEGTPEMMWASLLKLRDLPGDTRVYCGHEYTLANIKFAQTIEPGQRGARRARRAGGRAGRGRHSRPSRPRSTRRRRPTRSCAPTCRRSRPRSALPASRRRRCSPRSGRGRTSSERDFRSSRAMPRLRRQLAWT